jgi:hypothetical protein
MVLFQVEGFRIAHNSVFNVSAIALKYSVIERKVFLGEIRVPHHSAQRTAQTEAMILDPILHRTQEVVAFGQDVSNEHQRQLTITEPLPVPVWWAKDSVYDGVNVHSLQPVKEQRNIVNSLGCDCGPRHGSLQKCSLLESIHPNLPIGKIASNLSETTV